VFKQTIKYIEVNNPTKIYAEVFKQTTKYIEENNVHTLVHMYLHGNICAHYLRSIAFLGYIFSSLCSIGYFNCHPGGRDSISRPTSYSLRGRRRCHCVDLAARTCLNFLASYSCVFLRLFLLQTWFEDGTALLYALFCAFVRASIEKESGYNIQAGKIYHQMSTKYTKRP
jgi:hypothetical protein